MDFLPFFYIFYGHFILQSQILNILWTGLTLKVPLRFNYNFYNFYILEKVKTLTKTF